MTVMFDKHPDLREFDLIIVECSGGKDSAATLAVMYHRLKNIWEETPDTKVPPLIATHVDITDFAWPDAADAFRTQCAILGVPNFIEERELLPIVRHRGMWPSPECRYCTSDVKRTGLEFLLRQEANEFHATRILRCEGCRADESPRRSRLWNYHIDTRQTNTKRTVWLYLPIFRWSEDAVWNYIQYHDLPVPECYGLGFGRCGCPFCIYADRAQSDRAASLPELQPMYSEIRKLEHEMGHTLYQNRPWSYHAEKMEGPHV